MKRNTILSASVLALSLVAIVQSSLAATLTQTSKTGPGIANSRHNLTNWATMNGNNTVAGGTDQICVFCHTPHFTNTVNGAPLWNKGLPAAGSFTMYSSNTLDAPAGTLGGVSLACLSCHDGTQAMDNMINSPGLGTNNTTASLAGASEGYTFSEVTFMTSFNGGGDAPVNLGKDLSNDHPVGIEYCGGSVAAFTGSNCRDGGFKAAVNTNSNVWYVDTDSSATRSKVDLSLYNTAGGSTGTATVECATCHDPHTPDNGTFLRISNAQSGVCLACHTK